MKLRTSRLSKPSCQPRLIVHLVLLPRISFIVIAHSCSLPVLKKMTSLSLVIFLLFSEPAEFTAPEGAKEAGAELKQQSRSWDGLIIAKEYGLKLVGATWFRARSEEV